MSEKEKKSEGKLDKKGVPSREIAIEEKGKKTKKVTRLKDEELLPRALRMPRSGKIFGLANVTARGASRQVQPPSVGETQNPGKKL